MSKYLKCLIAFIICLFSLLLPYRLKVMFIETLGRIINSIYKIYVDVAKFILVQLERK